MLTDEPSPIDWTPFDTRIRAWATMAAQAPAGVVCEEIGPLHLPPVDMQTLAVHCREVHGLILREIRTCPIYLDALQDLHVRWHGPVTPDDEAALEQMPSRILIVEPVPAQDSPD